jgi:hypothetical protein
MSGVQSVRPCLAAEEQEPHVTRMTARLLTLLIAAGCGDRPQQDSRDVGAPSPADGGVFTPLDGGLFMPAPHGPLPQIVSLGGPVVRTPHVVPVFFGSDPLRAQIETYLQALAQSSYWSTTTAEYGVGPLVVDPSVVVSTPAPSVIDEATATQWFEQLLTLAGSSANPTRDTIYAVYPPSSTVVAIAYDSNVCDNDLGGGGFHDSVVFHGERVPFAVAARCRTPPGQTDLDVYSATMSHELIEAATDPVYEAAAFIQTDDAHAAFQVGTWGEVCDLCEYAPDSEFRPSDVPGLSQRCWSNLAAALGHDPCVPAVSQPYFNAVPVTTDTVAVTWSGYTFAAQGVRVPVGQTTTIEVDLFSDGPTPDWTVEALDYASTFDGGAPALELALDRISGNNGTKLQLSITVLRADENYGGEVFVLESMGSDGVMRSYWNGVVGN